MQSRLGHFQQSILDLTSLVQTFLLNSKKFVHFLKAKIIVISAIPGTPFI
jgi:hypothetical protein